MPNTAALAELDLIAERVGVDARRAIESFEMLEASNTPVTTALDGIETSAAHGHRVIQNAMRVMLAMEVSRLFDEGVRSKDRQTKASFPILAHRLQSGALRAALASRAGSVSPSRHQECLSALAEFDARWSSLQSDQHLTEAIRKLRTLRDYEIAHSIYDRQPDQITYQELFDLTHSAVELAHSATIAIGTGKTFFDEFQEDRREQSTNFWGTFVAGVRRTAPVK